MKKLLTIFSLCLLLTGYAHAQTKEELIQDMQALHNAFISCDQTFFLKIL